MAVAPAAATVAARTVVSDTTTTPTTAERRLTADEVHTIAERCDRRVGHRARKGSRSRESAVGRVEAEDVRRWTARRTSAGRVHRAPDRERRRLRARLWR